MQRHGTMGRSHFTCYSVTACIRPEMNTRTFNVNVATCSFSACWLYSVQSDLQQYWLMNIYCNPPWHGTVFLPLPAAFVNKDKSASSPCSALTSFLLYKTIRVLMVRKCSQPVFTQTDWPWFTAICNGDKNRWKLRMWWFITKLHFVRRTSGMQNDFSNGPVAEEHHEWST